MMRPLLLYVTPTGRKSYFSILNNLTLFLTLFELFSVPFTKDSFAVSSAYFSVGFKPLHTRAKNIKNKAHINEDPKDAMLREFQKEIENLKKQLDDGM